jgi:crotonobetainyl-CoA:carnitine CoA-transferase CaiB-like acyl-CoA transferase
MLEGVRVLDLTDESGLLAGKILGDLGADVIVVEPPGGSALRRRGPYLHDLVDPERSLAWLALNTSKRGVTLDLESERGRDVFRSLARTADVVIESDAPGAMDSRGLSYERLVAADPRLVYCSITPFGATGPRAHWRGHDLVVVSMGGNAHLTGHPDRPPVRCSMPTGYYHAAPEAALGIVMALYAREDTGRGQRVDVSLQETQLQTQLSFPAQYAHHGRAGRRSGERVGGLREIWPAADGFVSFGLRGGPTRVRNLAATAEYMNECGMAPPWLRDLDWSTYNHNTLADDEIARLEDAFGAFFRTRTRRELYEQALKRRILLAPCNDAREILEHRQLRDRELFVTLDYPELGATIEHPAFFAKADDEIRVRSRAPRIGEHNGEVYAELGLGPQVRAGLASQGLI